MKDCIITEDGTILYQQVSHQFDFEKFLGDKKIVEYFKDYKQDNKGCDWLCYLLMRTKSIAVWDKGFFYGVANEKQKKIMEEMGYVGEEETRFDYTKTECIAYNNNKGEK